MFWLFGCKACGILAPWPGIELAPLALKGKVLTTGLSGKSLGPLLIMKEMLKPAEKMEITTSVTVVWKVQNEIIGHMS